MGRNQEREYAGLTCKNRKSYTIVNSYVYNRCQPSLKLLFQIAEILLASPKHLVNIPDE
ncbi:hypothetical protein EJ73_02878 [Hoylesella shahii DSM 15611 = JCM 12083]|uniref:Helix-turn-helix protein n=1 Tax=Hoylesella shahii DSM 15611 = JCM 12083 TaxID=1122991 RepID=A0A318HTZ5_9BACT|nr:hypothetical protein EJ73_02878 [Hoylesella shahii DSM 15611 = JCM 12083]